MATKTRRDPTMGGQFALIPASVLYDDELPATAKLLYGEIYRLSHANGYCYASNAEFIRIVGCSGKTVSRLITALAERGHIRVKMIRRYGSEGGDIVQRRIFCGLALAPEDPPEVPPKEPDVPPVGVDPEPQNSDFEGTDKNDHTSGQKCPEGPDKNVQHTYLHENKSKRRENTIPPLVWHAIFDYIGDDPEYEAAFLGLLENRIALKKPVKTPMAAAGIINRLRKINCREIEIAMLEKATVHNWLTVYPLDPDEMPQGRSTGVVEEEGVTFIDD